VKTILFLLFSAISLAHAADHETFLAETRAASLKLREDKLRQTIARDTAWPHGTWGDNLWTLAALRLNQKTDRANARLLQAATQYIQCTGVLEI
jgi:hypothetical protein